MLEGPVTEQSMKKMPNTWYSTPHAQVPFSVACRGWHTRLERDRRAPRMTDFVLVSSSHTWTSVATQPAEAVAHLSAERHSQTQTAPRRRYQHVWFICLKDALVLQEALPSQTQSYTIISSGWRSQLTCSPCLHAPILPQNSRKWPQNGEFDCFLSGKTKK